MPEGLAARSTLATDGGARRMACSVAGQSREEASRKAASSDSCREDTSESDMEAKASRTASRSGSKNDSGSQRDGAASTAREACADRAASLDSP